ncbi:hypothetical protein BDV59DRAFT_185598 [Aspergillus ambiguus]|uniref:uncharacterized protein n=1 Tax=Aspergillus ambiguus TaxID=176160 RepID=UPI003CCE4D33
MEKTFASMCRSVFGLDKDVGKAETPRSVDTTARASSAGKPSPQSTEEASSVSARNDAASSAFGMNDRDDLEFDPISGRMSLRKPKATSPVTKDPEHESKRVGYLSPVPESGDSLKEPTKTDSKSDVTEDSAPAAKAPGRLIYEDGEAHPVDTRASSCQNTEPPKVNADNPEEVPLTPPKYPPGTNTNGMLQSKTEVPPIEIVSEDNNSEPQGATWSENPRPKSDSKPHATPFTPSWYSEPVISKDRAEDLDLLSASDIRSTYDSRVPEQDSEGQKRARHRALEESFDTYTDPAGGLDAQAIRQKYQHYQKSESVERSASEPPSPEPIIRSDLESSEDLAASQLPIHDESTSTVGQPNETNKTSASATPAPEIYHVLAYDPSTFQMTHAETSSSTRAANEALHPAEVLPLLNNPAKFMPYISKMHADGYEIVSGSGDVLVFRRGTSDRAGASLADVDNIDANVRNEPLFTESTESPKRTQGNETGTAESASIPPDPPSSTKTAYSSGSSAKDESKLGRTLRRMFISGAATAATCYALGVVSEYFRTGGQDGRGIDGFTEFESERRQQEREERASRS